MPVRAGQSFGWAVLRCNVQRPLTWPAYLCCCTPISPLSRTPVEFGTLIRKDGKVVFRELSADEITKLLKDADLDKKDDDGGARA